MFRSITKVEHAKVILKPAAGRGYIEVVSPWPEEIRQKTGLTVLTEGRTQTRDTNTVVSNALTPLRLRTRGVVLTPLGAHSPCLAIRGLISPRSEQSSSPKPAPLRQRRSTLSRHSRALQADLSQSAGSSKGNSLASSRLRVRFDSLRLS